jgi:WD40 repeat protein
VSDDKAFVQDVVVAEYYAEGFLRDLIRTGQLTRKETPSDNTARFAAYYGAERLPAELEAFLRMRDAYDLGYARLAEWRIWDDDVWLPDPESGNLAEQIITLDQQNYLGTCMLEYACCCIFLGTAGNGDAYFASFDPRNATSTAEVVYWNHETNSLEFPLADSLSSLAYANHLLAKVSGSDDDEEGVTDLSHIATEFRRISERVRLSWHYRSLEEVAELEGRYEGSSYAFFYFYRALWINYLLRNDGRADGAHKLSEVGHVFGLVDHGQQDLESAIAAGALSRCLVSAFYWLWRLFFLNKAEKLREVIAIARASANPVVRDMALLVAELQNGRRQLGSIADIHALREDFLKLDLDPDRAEERAREQAERERLAAEQKAMDERRVADALATSGVEGLVALAWENLGNKTIVEPIYQWMRTHDPRVAADVIRADFHFDHAKGMNERWEVLEALGWDGDRRLAPVLLTLGGTALAPTVARMGDGRALPAIAAMLDERSTYNHELILAVKAAGHLRASELVGKLMALIDEFMYVPGDFKAEIRNKKLLWALFEALAEIGDAHAAPAIEKIAASGHQDLAARALVSLGRLGDASCIEVVLAALQGAFARPAMFALAHLGDGRAMEATEALVARRRGARARSIYERLMLDALRSRCGRAISLDNARFALTVVEANKYEGVELHETAIDLLARHVEEEERLTLLAPLLDAAPMRIRRMARLALGRDGTSVPATFYDRATVDAIFADRGTEGLRAAFGDPRGALRHNLVRKAVDENLGATLEPELIAYGRDLLRFKHYTYRYAKDKWQAKADALDAICNLGGAAVDQLTRDVFMQENCMWVEALSSKAKEWASRIDRVERQDQPPPGEARPLQSEPMGVARWSLGGMINGMRFSADGEKLIVVGGQGGAGGAAAIFDRNGAEVMQLPAVLGWAYDVDIHPDGRMAAVGLHAGHLLLIDLATGEVLADLKGHGGVPDGVRKVRFSPDGTLLASASDDESLIVWDVAARQMRDRIHDKFDVNTVDWFPDGRRIVFGTDKQIGIIDFDADGATAVVRRFDSGPVAEVRVFAEGTRIAAGGSTTKGLLILDDALNVVRTFDQRYVARIRFSPDENLLFAVSWDGEKLARRWDMATGEAIDLPGHDNAALFALDLDPQTGEPYAGGKNNIVASWRSDCSFRETINEAHSAKVEAVIPGMAGEIVSAAADGSVIRWMPARAAAQTTYRLTRLESAEPMRLKAVAVSPDGATMLATGFDGAVAFGAANGVVLWRQDALQRSQVAFGVEGAFVVGSGGALTWLDAENGAIVHSEDVSAQNWLHHLLPLADGRRAVVWAFEGRSLHLYDLTARRRLASVALPVRGEKANGYGVGQGGGRLVVSRWDASFDAFDADTLQHRVEAYERLPCAPVAVSPDGSLIACGEDELRLFNAESFNLVGCTSLGHKISALCFVGPTHVVAGLDNGQVVSVRIGQAGQ